MSSPSSLFDPCIPPKSPIIPGQQPEDVVASQMCFILEWLHAHDMLATADSFMSEIGNHKRLCNLIKKPSTETVDSAAASTAPGKMPSAPLPAEEDGESDVAVTEMDCVRKTGKHDLTSSTSAPPPSTNAATPSTTKTTQSSLPDQLRQLVDEMSAANVTPVSEVKSTTVMSPPPETNKTNSFVPCVTEITSQTPSKTRTSTGTSSLPTLPQNVGDDPLPGDDSVDTWTPEDIGYVPVACRSVEEEVAQLWPVEEASGVLLEAPVFPYGGGLSAAKVVRVLCDSTLEPEACDGETPFKAPTAPPRNTPDQPLQLEVFDLKVIYEVGRTGFEENKDFPIVVNSLIANRYQVMEYIGSAAFSRAVQCLDLKTDQQVCIKIIRNSKDFFDQSLDEIKLLQYLNTAGDSDDHCVLQLYDYFYYREHLFLVCELLKDNLYEFAKYNREHPEEPFYFTMPRMQKIARSIVEALKFIHGLQLMHCDLKPENILVRSYSRCEVKVIDFGSSCFTTDHLSSYVQSRCYRAPEVILGMPYDQRIDVWSLGAILPELLTGQVLFHNDSVPQMLARIASLCGPYSPEMLRASRHAPRFFTRNGVAYERREDEVVYLYSKPTPLRHRLGCTDELFVDFVSRCLTLDYTKRPTAAELLEHPFLQHDYGPINPE
eukprot:PhM_4_TR588/c1_g1_i1/m.86295